MKIFKSLIIACVLLPIGNTAFPEAKTIFWTAAYDLNVRKEPSMKSDSLVKLNYGDWGYILKEKKTSVVLNNKKGKWVYVDVKTRHDDIKGWVFDYYIATRQKFKRVNNWKYKSFYAIAGDYAPQYSFRKDGYFTIKEYMFKPADVKEKDLIQYCINRKGKSKKLKGKLYCNHLGYLYKYLNLYVARIKGIPFNEKYVHFFVHFRNNEFCIPDGGCGTAKKF